MADITQPPWTAEQCLRLNLFQAARYMHPFTCPRHHMYPEGVSFPPAHPADPVEVTVAKHRQILEEARVALEENPPVWVPHACLVALPDGWHCPMETCDYTQDWAYASMLERPPDYGTKLNAVMYPEWYRTYEGFE